PELGQLEARQIAALAGLAPVTRESGTWRGKATIQGGRRPLRRALTMPVLTAIRRNRDLAALFTRLRTAGKPPGSPLSRRCANSSSPPTHSCAKDGTGRTQGQYKTLDEHGYWPGALAPGWQGSAWRCGKGDGLCQDAQGARRRKRFPLSGQAARAVGTFSAPCQAAVGVLPGADRALRATPLQRARVPCSAFRGVRSPPGCRRGRPGKAPNRTNPALPDPDLSCAAVTKRAARLSAAQAGCSLGARSVRGAEWSRGAGSLQA
ncbi:MAG: IS110 family transposase, partial [Rhodobacter sp.]|nr:IS110 family transposase [Rhodobacter sp.]